MACTQVVAVGTAEVGVKSIICSPAQVVPGQNTTCSVTAVNVGNASSTAFTVYVVFDGKVILKQLNFAGLLPSRESTLSFVFPVPVGTHTVCTSFTPPK